MSNNDCFDLTEPENALALKIKEKVLDRVTNCSTKEQVREELLNIINENYDNLDIDKIKTSSRTTQLALDSFIACSLEDTPTNFPDVQIQINNLLESAIDLVCNPPNFNIPYPFPIIDLTFDFRNELLLALLRIASKILLSIVTKLLSLIIDVCTSGTNAQTLFGSANIGQILAESIGEGLAESTDFINDVFNAFGIDANGQPNTSVIQGQTCEDVQELAISNLKSTEQLLNDLSSLLTPLEVCDLLENSASEQTLDIINEFIGFEYPYLKVAFSSKTKIRDFFSILGKKADPKFCQTIRNNAQAIASSPDLCFTEDAETIRKNLLGQKGLSDEDIQNLLDKERERQKDNLATITSLITSIKSDPNRLFGDQQDIFCKGGQPGLVSPSNLGYLQERLGKTLDSTINIFAITCNKELDNFASTYITQEKVINEDEPVIEKYTTLVIQKTDGSTATVRNAINPTFTEKTSYGSATICDNEGNSDEGSVNSYYPNSVKTDEGDIDIQKLVSPASKKDLDIGAKNVYIVNYSSQPKVALDIFNENYGLLTKLDDLISIDTSNMSISINIPTKFVPFGQQTSEPDFTSVTSTDNMVVYTLGK
jgi:hypothetical protein